MARTDYIVNGPADCLLFLTASKADAPRGPAVLRRTTDGGLTWRFVSFIGPEPSGYAIMPSTVRLSPTELVTTIRLRDAKRSWIDAYASHDDGRSWRFLTTPEPDTGEGNPPSLVRLRDGRLCLTYGVRARPYRHLRPAQRRRRPDLEPGDRPPRRRRRQRRRLCPLGRPARRQGRRGLLLHRRTGPTRYIAATIFDPGKRGR